MQAKVNKAEAVKVAAEIKDQCVAEWVDSDDGPWDKAFESPDCTVLRKSDGYTWTVNRPKLESLNPCKGALMFVKAIYEVPGLKSFKHYLVMTGSKLTSHSTTRVLITHCWGLVTQDYHVTDRGRRLLKAYGLI
jgi:hypothetical protein